MAKCKNANRDRNVKRGRASQPRHLDRLLSPELEMEPDEVRHRGTTEPIKAMTENQGLYLNSLRTNTLTFGIGPAGTGKTYVAAAYAADLIRDKKIDKIIITRPAVEAGESLGFLPGDMDEKFDPYFAPVRDILIERLGSGMVEYLIKNKRIEVKPLAYMRGTTFKNAFVLLDEAQNTTPQQMLLFLTRIGENSRISVNGDLKQTDLRGITGLLDAVKRCRNIKSAGIVEFGREDIVRSGIVREIIEAYEDDIEPEFVTPAFFNNDK